jgi:hypothetical protein
MRLIENSQIWLKAVGTAEQPLDRHWLDQRTNLLQEVHFPPRVPSIRANDRFVYYAAGWQKIFAAGKFVTDPSRAHAKEDDRWPWRAEVHVFLLVPDLTLAPHLTRADINTFSVRSKSHIKLSEQQYRAAVGGLADAAGLSEERYAALAWYS